MSFVQESVLVSSKIIRCKQPCMQPAPPSKPHLQQRKNCRSVLPEKSSKKRVASGVSWKLKAQKKWKPLPESSMNALVKILDSSILYVLVTKTKDKESQKHLNAFKDRFLVHCADLLVPPETSEDQMSSQKRVEKNMEKLGQKLLLELENKVVTVTGHLEVMSLEKTQLEKDIENIKESLREKERNAQEIFQLYESAVLQLPPLARRTDKEPLLQEQMMKLVPDGNAANDLAAALQSSEAINCVRQFLELAHKQADQLLT